MDDWNQNNSSWSGYGDDPWDMPPKTSARPQRHASRDESAGHSAAPGHTIGSCDADYANEAVNPGRKRFRWRRIVLPLVVALIAAIAPNLGLPVEAGIFAALTVIATLASRTLIKRVNPTDEPDINDRDLRLVGERARVVEAFVDGRGRVFVSGAEWPAEIEGGGPLAGESVVVESVDGPRLRVRAV